MKFMKERNVLLLKTPKNITQPSINRHIEIKTVRLISWLPDLNNSILYKSYPQVKWQILFYWVFRLLHKFEYIVLQVVMRNCKNHWNMFHLYPPKQEIESVFRKKNCRLGLSNISFLKSFWFQTFTEIWYIHWWFKQVVNGDEYGVVRDVLSKV